MSEVDSERNANVSRFKTSHMTPRGTEGRAQRLRLLLDMLFIRRDTQVQSWHEFMVNNLVLGGVTRVARCTHVHPRCREFAALARALAQCNVRNSDEAHRMMSRAVRYLDAIRHLDVRSGKMTKSFFFYSL